MVVASLPLIKLGEINELLTVARIHQVDSREPAVVGQDASRMAAGGSQAREYLTARIDMLFSDPLH